MAIPLPSWKHRRRLVYATLVYCAVAVTAIIAAGVMGNDSSLLAQIGIALIGLVFTVLGVYIGGAAWGDKNVMKYSQPAAPAPAPENLDEVTE